jgi:hypothetical protein
MWGILLWRELEEKLKIKMYPSEITLRYLTGQADFQTKDKKSVFFWVTPCPCKSQAGSLWAGV